MTPISFGDYIDIGGVKRARSDRLRVGRLVHTATVLMSTRTLTIARCPARGQAVMLCGECDSAHTQDRMRDGPIGAMGRWGGAAGGGGGRTPRGPLDATTPGPALAARSHNDNLYSCIHNTRLGSWCTVIGRLWTRSDVKLKARVKRCVRSRRNSNSMPVEDEERELPRHKLGRSVMGRARCVR